MTLAREPAVVDVHDGIRRVTFPLPLGIDHVHCYLLRGDDGAWTVVDTGLGLPGTRERWSPLVADLAAPVERIVITHAHPDHVGDAAGLAELTAATVFQGRLDRARSVAVWGGNEWHERVSEHLRAHGMPPEEVREAERHARAVARHVHLPREPVLLDAGATVGGWEVVVLPGHADGHLALIRDGVVVAGDVILAGITPTVGVYPGGLRDPLGAYLESLARLAELDVRLALCGHGPAIHDPAGRAREIVDHHRVREEATRAALAEGPRNAYEVSLALFGDELVPSLRRFAVTEALAHLERLVLEGGAARSDRLYALA